MEKARSHERREDTSQSKEEVREGVVMCNEVMINIASREEAMIQGSTIGTDGMEPYGPCKLRATQTKSGPSLKVSLNEHTTGSTPLPTAALKSTSSPLPSAPMPSGHRPPQGLGDDLALCVSMNQERITTYSCA
ncbi:hypothetical protein N665_1189s0001 [Sinapis alba]|nr:hypothetical protein N665_1189s0001 [Sinapis alba]